MTTPLGTFLSYSRADSDFVDLLHRLLTSKGFDAWVDHRDIAAGSRWDNKIEEAIRFRTHLTVVLSPEAVESQNVADEWSYALDEGKVIIPILYRKCTLPMRLRRLNWIDFTSRPFAGAFADYLRVLGEPDYRPNDRFELARRDGMIFIKFRQAYLQIAFVYSDFPHVTPFLHTVWFTMLWSTISKDALGDLYGYGDKWSLRNLVTDEIYPKPKTNADPVFLHEIGIEPNSSLEVVLHI